MYIIIFNVKFYAYMPKTLRIEKYRKLQAVILSYLLSRQNTEQVNNIIKQDPWKTLEDLIHSSNAK